MSSSYWESRARQYRRDLEKALKKRGDEEGKAAKAEEKAARAEESTRRASSPSSASSKRREAERKRKEAQKARTNAAAASKKAGELQGKIHEAEQKAARNGQREEASEARKRAARDRSEERRARWYAEREAREEAARDAAREREVVELRQRTAELEALVRRAQDEAPSQITVLFLAGTLRLGDEAPLRLDREVREIQQRIRASEHRDAIKIEDRMATRVTDILQALNEVEPDVVHFAGHGGEEALVFEGNDGQPHVLSDKDLALLLQAVPKPIRLAVFNSCESSSQAALACDYVESAIGMDEPIADEAAQEFAGQLYNSLGFGQDLALAFNQAKAQMSAATGEGDAVPRLFTAPDVEAEQIVLVRPGDGSPPSSE